MDSIEAVAEALDGLIGRLQALSDADRSDLPLLHALGDLRKARQQFDRIARSKETPEEQSARYDEIVRKGSEG